MGSLFSKKSSAPKSRKHEITEKDRAMLDLKNARDRLKKFRKKLEVDSEKLQNQALSLYKQKLTDRALLVIKLKKFKEKELNNVDSQLISVLEMIENVEWESANLEVLKALKSGNDALNKIHEEMSVDDVANLLEETNEAIQTENEINAMLAGQFNPADEEELQRELALLMGETEKEKSETIIEELPLLPKVPEGPVLPPVPSQNIEIRKNTENQNREEPILS